MNTPITLSTTQLNPKVLKHDNFAHLLRRMLDLDTQRFAVSCLLSQGQRTKLNGAEFYTIDLDIYMELSSPEGKLYRSKAFTEVRDLALHYRDTTYKVTLVDGSTLYTSLFYEVIVDEMDKTVKVRWNDSIIPLISGDMPKSTYSWYPSKLVEGKNPRVIALADFLHRHSYRFTIHKTTKLSFRTTELREESGCLEVYPQFKHFNASIIQPAVRLLAAQGDKMGVLEVKGNKHTVTFYAPGHTPPKNT